MKEFFLASICAITISGCGPIAQFNTSFKMDNLKVSDEFPEGLTAEDILLKAQEQLDDKQDSLGKLLDQLKISDYEYDRNTMMIRFRDDEGTVVKEYRYAIIGTYIPDSSSWQFGWLIVLEIF